MTDIRSGSDLRNKFTEIENTVRSGSPVYLTKNGYDSMVVMSIEAYSHLTGMVKDAPDAADKAAADLTDAVEAAILQRLPVCESFEPYRSAMTENIRITGYMSETMPYTMSS